MNDAQERWWEQARSDHRIFLLLRRNDAEPCHQLHYLQMASEKLGKAYLWRTGRPARRSHLSFVTFLLALNDRSKSDLDLIAALLGFGHGRAFESWLRPASSIAHALERTAPALAGDGANAEYPWPHASPVHSPATYEFDIWKRPTETARGRQFVTVIEAAVRTFPRYA